MSVVKVIEVLAESEKSWEDAARMAVEKAGKSLHGIKSLYVQDMRAKVRDGRITSYRINAKISFKLDD